MLIAYKPWGPAFKSVVSEKTFHNLILNIEAYQSFVYLTIEKKGDQNVILISIGTIPHIEIFLFKSFILQIIFNLETIGKKEFHIVWQRFALYEILFDFKCA